MWDLYSTFVQHQIHTHLILSVTGMPNVARICDKAFYISKINFELLYMFKKKSSQMNLILAVPLLLIGHHYIQLCIPDKLHTFLFVLNLHFKTKIFSNIALMATLHLAAYILKFVWFYIDYILYNENLSKQT